MRRTFPPIQTVLTGAMVAIVGFFSSFAILLQGLVSIGASETQAASGLMAAALSMGVAGIVLSLATRLPVSVAWSTPGAALLAVTAPAAGGFPEAVGAFVIAGCLTLFAGLCKPLGRFASSIPAPLAKAMLAGILLPLCLRPFQAAVDIPYFVLPLFLIWLVAGRINRFLGVPATVVAAAIMIFATADLSSMSQVPLIATPDMTVPQFSLAAALGIAVPLF
ncbi:MAG: benzoate/H(+) symporter BenE family transporter, partial [Porticoccaceae bacterium]|nr:benzoate/H(+) symporter BenE family transporter [Porticoccaceae bacterium]